MRFSITNLVALVLLLTLSSPLVLAAPTVPGIGRHRNPATVAGRQTTNSADIAARAPAALAGPEVAAAEPLKRADLLPEYEKRMGERMVGVVGAIGEAKVRNEQKKHKRTRLARFHP